MQSALVENPFNFHNTCEAFVHPGVSLPYMGFNASPPPFNPLSPHRWGFALPLNKIPPPLGESAPVINVLIINLAFGTVTTVSGRLLIHNPLSPSPPTPLRQYVCSMKMKKRRTKNGSNKNPNEREFNVVVVQR